MFTASTIHQVTITGIMGGAFLSRLNKVLREERGGSYEDALRRASGCGPLSNGIEVRNAVETVVATASGVSIAFGESKRIQPSPSVGCRPRTRATSNTIATTFVKVGSRSPLERGDPARNAPAARAPRAVAHRT